MQSRQFTLIIKNARKMRKQNYSNVNTESIFRCFRQFKFLAQIEYFAKAIASTRWPIFNIVSFLECLVFFRAVFCTGLYSNMNTESILTCFRQFKFLALIEYFAKAIAFGRRPIFFALVTGPC